MIKKNYKNYLSNSVDNKKDVDKKHILKKSLQKVIFLLYIICVTINLI